MPLRHSQRQVGHRKSRAKIVKYYETTKDPKTGKEVKTLIHTGYSDEEDTALTTLTLSRSRRSIIEVNEEDE